MDTPLAQTAAEATAASGWPGVVAVTLVVGIVSVFMYFRPDKWLDMPDLPSGTDGNLLEEEEEDDSPPVYKEVPPEYMPEGGVFTLATLEPLNGIDLPLCMGVCGKVVNVSTSLSIRGGQAGYGALWAGKEATYSLALSSLKPEDVEKMDYRLEDFTEEQRKALAGWYKHFTTKYVIVGTLKEYDGWDFSEILELAKEQTPFGAKKDSDLDQSDEAEAKADPAEAAADSSARADPAPAQEIPKDAQVFNAGDRVELRNLVASQELNGSTGILTGFNQEKGRFVVRLEALDKVMLFKPENLLVLKDSS